MQRLTRRVVVDQAIQVTSEWMLPDMYRAGVGSGVVLAHGAGNDMHDPLLSFLHRTLAQRGFLAVKFNFPYKERGQKPPDRMPVLEATWRAVVRAVCDDPDLAPGRLVIGGKSMGGRVASHIAAQGEGGDALLFLGYPLHAQGKAEVLRAAHLQRVRCPMLFVQGTRDPLCDLARLEPVLASLQSVIQLHRIAGGDHSFRVLRRLKRNEIDVWSEIATVVVDWIRGLGER